MNASGKPIWTIAPPILDFRSQTDVMRLSEDGKSSTSAMVIPALPS